MMQNLYNFKSDFDQTWWFTFGNIFIIILLLLLLLKTVKQWGKANLIKKYKLFLKALFFAKASNQSPINIQFFCIKSWTFKKIYIFAGAFR